MQNKSTYHFYSELKEHKHFISDVLRREKCFETVPSDWHVIITDVKNSSKAIQDGNHEIVNLIATGSIIAILNIANQYKISIPFFFGGDGATMIVPNEIKEECVLALKKHQENTHINFDLFLRVGEMPVSNIYSNNYRLKIAKAKINDSFSIPMVIGAGLHFAEKIIKQNQVQYLTQGTANNYLNLEGMECRWDKIKPPENEHSILSLLVSATNKDNQAPIYADILDNLELIYGSHKKRSPISIHGLNLDASWDRINRELKVKEGRRKTQKIIKRVLSTTVGKFYLRFNREGRKYLSRLIELTDTLVLDGRINTVITGSKMQHEKLINYLNKLEEAKSINYGYHISSESIMSCYVRDLKGQHIHFVDGGGGGYTKAANALKEKLN